MTSVCSYTLVAHQNPSSSKADSNLFELIFDDFQNVLIGLYYSSSSEQGGIVDLGLIDPSIKEDC